MSTHRSMPPAADEPRGLGVARAIAAVALAMSLLALALAMLLSAQEFSLADAHEPPAPAAAPTHASA